MDSCDLPKGQIEDKLKVALPAVVLGWPDELTTRLWETCLLPDPDLHHPEEKGESKSLLTDSQMQIIAAEMKEEITDERLKAVMAKVHNRVKREVPYWYQITSEYGFSPLDPDLEQQDLGRSIKFVDPFTSEHARDAISGLLLETLDTSGMMILGQIRIQGRFPDLRVRLHRLLYERPLNAESVNRTDFYKAIPTLELDQTGLELVYHEITHKKQIPHWAMPLVTAVCLAYRCGLRFRERSTPLSSSLGIAEYQAFSNAGNLSCFIRPEKIAEWIGGNYLARNYFLSQGGLAQAWDGMNEEKKDQYILDYMRSDPNKTIARTREGINLLERLTTLLWLQSIRARNEGKKPPAVNHAIGKILGKSHYVEGKGWLHLDREITSQLSGMLGEDAVTYRQDALSALDDITSSRYASQREDFYTVKRIAREEYLKELATLRKVDAEQTDFQQTLWDDVCESRFMAMIPHFSDGIVTSDPFIGQEMEKRVSEVYSADRREKLQRMSDIVYMVARYKRQPSWEDVTWKLDEDVQLAEVRERLGESGRPLEILIANLVKIRNESIKIKVSGNESAAPYAEQIREVFDRNLSKDQTVYLAIIHDPLFLDILQQTMNYELSLIASDLPDKKHPFYLIYNPSRIE